ncbi:MAG: His/Gly/Thr/Pro-type tRNA ligase C-terminal domain-containing protein [Planctomycetaceae bacterium]
MIETETDRPPWCITIDGETVDQDNTVTLRDRDTLASAVADGRSGE